MVPGVEVEPLAPLRPRKLFRTRSGKIDEIDTNAQVRYTTGTRQSTAVSRTLCGTSPLRLVVALRVQASLR